MNDIHRRQRKRIAAHALIFAVALAVLAGPVRRPARANSLSAQGRDPARLTLRIGGHVGSVSVRDLNADGTLDILAARLDTGTLSVYLGDGLGRFSEAEGSPVQAGHQPEDIAVADLNGDGRLDVAVANHETDHLNILLGDGRGRLAPAPRSPVRVPSLPHLHGVVSGDFNGDSRQDLAVESRDEDSVLVLYGDGDGGFAAAPLRLAVGRAPYWKLRGGDVNGDGRHDLVTTNSEGGSLSVLLSGGRGSFQPAQNLLTEKTPFAVGIGDVNGDGRPDLATAHYQVGPGLASDRVTILLGRPDGAFTPAPGSPFQTGRSSVAVAIGDFDGDAIADVAVANMASNDVTLLGGGRSGMSLVRGSPFSVGQGPGSVALADVNADGRADIVTGNWGSGDVSVLFSQ